MNDEVNLEEFIPLGRTFHELTYEQTASDEVDFSRVLGVDKPINWEDLLLLHRVIILSEAGSGKTTEIRHIARSLRNKGRMAFFLRLEHVSTAFEDSFEEGRYEEFQKWTKSGEECWIFLDSVDEARLRDPKDFERAIRKIGNQLASALQNVHIVITGRTHAWRPTTDLLLCQNAFPLAPATDAYDGNEISDASGSKGKIEASAAEDTSDPFRVVTLDDLGGSQIDAFARARGVTDITAFRDAIDQMDAWSFTTRPLDLAEVIEFWNKHKRIGSRLDLMRSSINRRLEESDQDRAEARPIDRDKLRRGAQLVAAASTLAQESAIRIPDGAQNISGIPIKEVLIDWDDADCATLLSRPIFDEGIYGTVRFHHRSVREFLTAEWLQSLIVGYGSRVKVENLFFRTQYGIEVIVPTMRPVLPWLAILDERILVRVRRLAPEVIFEGGDPSQLPHETRAEILQEACERIAQPAHNRSITDYAAVQRFANVDLTEDVRRLLAKYAENDNVAWFLLRLIWQGAMAGAADEAMRFSLESRAKYTRLIALRALRTVGSEAAQEEVREAIFDEEGKLDRDWVAELVLGLSFDKGSLSWLLQILERAPKPRRYHIDSLTDSVSHYAVELPIGLLPQLIEGLSTLLATAPFIERRHCEVSEKYSWLAAAAAKAVIRLLEVGSLQTFEAAPLSTLRNLPALAEYSDRSQDEYGSKLSELVRAWPELNYALFWHDVAETRAAITAKKGGRLTEYWRVGSFHHYWEFGPDSFERITADIEGRPDLDDRLVALSLAFWIYRQHGRPPAWRKRLKRISAKEEALYEAYTRYFHPPAAEQQREKRREQRWKQKLAREAARNEDHRRNWRRYLEDHSEDVRNAIDPERLTNAQRYLYERMREESGSSSSFTEGYWRSLIPEFGERIAQDFRDGAVAYWRRSHPILRSEGAEPNQIPFNVIFGLTGISIEAREAGDWISSISSSDAAVATRLAIYELNGFPAWLRTVYDAHPNTVIDVIIREIEHEVASERRDTESHYVLSAVSWGGQWMWESLAPLILKQMDNPPENISNLRHMIAIIQGSMINDAIIAELAEANAKKGRDPVTAPIWFAVWAGVDAAAAIPALTTRLSKISKQEEQTLFAMRFVTSLLGERREALTTRQGFRTVDHLKNLYLLMQQHIREDEDIERAGKGVYSPGLRDDAQHARNALFAFIKEVPGKAAFLAMDEISRFHPNTPTRPWISLQAKAKATADSDLPIWQPGQVREFHDNLESTPADHRELWYLAVDRIVDLKRDLEDGDESIASILIGVQAETEMRKFIAGWLRDHSGGRYNIPQEEELADAKRPDLRVHGKGFDAPVPVELKLADKWRGPQLFERLETQLCRDYLRDIRSGRGIFLLVYSGTRQSWHLPGGDRVKSLAALVDALQVHWANLAYQMQHIEDVKVIGIDLTKRKRKV